MFNIKSDIIPKRNTDMPSGSQFILNNPIGINREENILKEFLAGNIPNFLRQFASIEITNNKNTIVYIVMTDYLSIGDDDDYVRMPMSPITAQKIANAYDCSLPTKKMVMDIWKNSKHQLQPLPWGPPYDNSMFSSERILNHNKLIQNQLFDKDKSLLISGHKKDVVLTNKLSPNNYNKRVAIYGWIQNNGQPIQGLNPHDHDDQYSDYSHGIRLIANDVLVNGQLTRLQEVMRDPELCNLVSDEGIVTFLNYL